MNRAEVLAKVLAEHQRSVARAGNPCICGSWPTGHRREGDWTEHVAAALDAALAQEGDQGEAVDEAFIHARWHRALDDPDREPPGPIRDHIRAAFAAVPVAGDAVRETLDEAGDIEPVLVQRLALKTAREQFSADLRAGITYLADESWPFGPEQAARLIASVSWPNEREGNRDGWAVRMLTDRPDLLDTEAPRARARLEAAIRCVRDRRAPQPRPEDGER